MLDNVPRDNVGLIVSPRRITEGARGSWVKRAVPRQNLRDTVPRPGCAHRGPMGSRDKVLIMFLTSKPRAGALARNLIIRPWAPAPWYFESGYNDSMIMRPYLTHGSGPGDTAGEEIAAPFVRMETMSVDPPTPRTRTVPRRAGVIPPIIKLLSCGWHPRATRGTRPGLRSPLGLIRHVLHAHRSSLLILPFRRSFPPAVFLSVRFSSILVDCPTRRRRAHSFRDALERTIRNRSPEAFLSILCFLQRE